MKSAEQRAREVKHAAIWQRVYRTVRARWYRNKSDDEIRDAVSQAYMRALRTQVRKGEDLNADETHWIVLKASTLLTGKRREVMRESRAVNCSASPALRSGIDGGDRMMAPHEWVDSNHHSEVEQSEYTPSAVMQGSASEIEGGIIDSIDLKLQIEKMSTARDALDILVLMRYKPVDIAAALTVLRKRSISRQAVSLWTHGEAIPLRYQRHLIAMVDDRTTIDAVMAERLEAEKAERIRRTAQNAPQTIEADVRGDASASTEKPPGMADVACDGPSCEGSSGALSGSQSPAQT